MRREQMAPRQAPIGLQRLEGYFPSPAPEPHLRCRKLCLPRRALSPSLILGEAPHAALPRSPQTAWLAGAALGALGRSGNSTQRAQGPTSAGPTAPNLSIPLGASPCPAGTCLWHEAQAHGCSQCQGHPPVSPSCCFFTSKSFSGTIHPTEHAGNSD